MSWFTDIAGKAEDLLNRVDQTAATALQNKGKTSSFKPDDQFLKSSRSDGNFGTSYSTNSAFSSPQKNKTSRSTRPSENKNLYSPSLSTTRKKPESDDEKLLRFLNSTETVLSEQHKQENQMNTVNKPKELTPAISEVDSAVKTSKIKSNFFFNLNLFKNKTLFIMYNFFIFICI